MREAVAAIFVNDKNFMLLVLHNEGAKRDGRKDPLLSRSSQPKLLDLKDERVHLSLITYA